MGLVEDDSILHPDIGEDCLMYVTNLDEGPDPYTRFFDALLIKRNLHTRFYRDLKAFREQAQVISTLEKASADKKLYRSTTLIYLESRFAHPWCRKTPMKKAFWRAEWGSIEGKQKDIENTREEERLHKLLVPLWIIMRSKMFPGETVVKEWCAKERERVKGSQQSRLTMQALKQHDEATSTWDLSQKPDKKRQGPVNDYEDSEDIEDADEHEAAAHAATSVFRLAAAGMILSQTPKRKLRWLTMS